MAYLQTCRSRGKIYSYVKNNFVYTLLIYPLDTYLKKISWKSIDFFKKNVIA